MNLNDTAYIHRSDEKGLLRSILDGSFDEDIRVYDLKYSRDRQRNAYGVFTNKISTTPRTLYINMDMIGNSHNGGLSGFLARNNSFNSVKLVINSDTGNTIRTQNFFNTARSVETIEICTTMQRGNLYLLDAFRYCSSLKTLILRLSTGLSQTGNHFNNVSNLDTIVLDSNSVVPCLLGFNNLPAFKSGGTGGTIYIPKVLYDHLGDGSEYDYKSATNWSLVDSYGTITWAQIEGSEYEAE